MTDWRPYEDAVSGHVSRRWEVWRRQRQRLHPDWCELAPDHEGRCHTAECGYGRNHGGLCWFTPTWPWERLWDDDTDHA